MENENNGAEVLDSTRGRAHFENVAPIKYTS
jgi:hypothetical protein